MKETEFVAQNKHKWERFEKLSKQKNNNPDEVAELFTEITEDLSYARTFYPRRSVRVYLNQLAQGVFTKLYKQRKAKVGSFKKFWSQDVPIELYRSRYNLLSALVFFLLAIFIGVVSQHYDENFVNLILGESYVRITETNIEKGDPMGVYGNSDSTQMFFMITINNIRVAFITFVLGILASLGSYYMLLKNGIMLGTFQYWFKAKGLLLTSFLTIWIHGAFEISAIVIAGGAGITVGSGLLFPKSYTRLQSLVFSAKRGLLIMISLVPIFIIAGFLESYVTRHYLSMSNTLKLSIILISFAIIILYYGIYPFVVAKKYPHKINIKEVPKYIPDRKIELFKIRKTNDFFSDSFYLFLTKINQFSQLFFKVSLPVYILIFVVNFSFNFYDFNYKLNVFDQFSLLFGMRDEFNIITFFMWPIFFTFCIASVYFIMDENYKSKTVINFLKYTLKPFFWLYLYCLTFFSIIVFIPVNIITFIIFILIAPIILLLPAYILIEKQTFFKALFSPFKLEKKTYGEGIGNLLLLTLIGFIFFFILRNPFTFGPLYLLDEILRDTLIIKVEFFRVIINAIDLFIYLLFLGGLLTLITISSVFFYYSNKEKKEAVSLFKKFKNFGKHSRIYETKTDFE
ncbi:MAG TPA: stage II sporulation protein M [Crocinitomix sp.]|nr:stage II sporulation protein M [Crocinitomix sp.]